MLPSMYPFLLGQQMMTIVWGHHHWNGPSVWLLMGWWWPQDSLAGVPRGRRTFPRRVELLQEQACQFPEPSAWLPQPLGWARAPGLRRVRRPRQAQSRALAQASRLEGSRHTALRGRGGGGSEAQGSGRQARGEGRPSKQKWGERAGGFCQSPLLTTSFVRLTAALQQGEFFRKESHSHAAKTSATYSWIHTKIKSKTTARLI